MTYLEHLLDFGVGHVLVVLIGTAGVVEFTVHLADKLFARFGIETKWSLRRKSDERILQRHEKEIEATNAQLKKIVDKVNAVSLMMIEMQSRSDASERARLKDRIAQAYRYYHEKKEWTQMDKDAFNDLIKSYELAGGKNSFVHSICEPESCTWKIIDG